MRLTLRNMLAYMDGLLEAEDAEDIGRRISESDQASTLLHRMRDVMRRLRLAAPRVTDRESGLDANTVAEYLDHTLHDNRVTDFEKVCLDSDVHLAEVASCHQILALVLGEAAEIDPASRERMYGLPGLQTAEAAAPPIPPSAEAASGDGEPADREPRLKPTVPDYLREPPKKRRLLPVAIALGLILCVVVIVLGATGQFKSGTPLGNALASLVGSQRADVPRDGQPGSEPAHGPNDKSGSESSEDPATVPPEKPASVPPEEPATVPPEEPASVPPEEPATVPPEEPVTEPPAEPDVVPLPEPSKALLMSERQVLLRFDPEAAHWERVPEEGPVTAGQTLLALPTYRPKILLLSVGIRIQLIDGSQAQLLPSDVGEAPGLKVDYGRVVIRTVGKPEAQIRLQVGNRGGLITFPDADSILALEVIPVHIPGSDPEADPPSVVAEMYAESGQILWEEADREQPMRVPAGDRVMLSERPTQTAAPVEEFPKWVTGDHMDWPDQGVHGMASNTLEKRLEVERSQQFGARLALTELSNHSRIENRWLAARCLGYVGDFGPLVAALNDEDHPPVWTDEAIEHLRVGVARSAETAALVREALQKQYGQDAPELYRMLWGYTVKGLKAEGGREAEELVEYLNHETLAMRTLSFWNLRAIFGMTLLYKPTDRETVRRVHAQRWKQRLESGEIWKLLGESRTTSPADKTPPPEDAERQP